MIIIARSIFLLLFWPSFFLQAAPETAAFKPGKLGACHLETVQDTPVLTLCGDPETMGKAQGTLLREEGAVLIRSFLQPASLLSGGMEHLKKQAMKMEPHIPLRYRKELKAMAEAANQEYAVVLTGCAFNDVYRMGGCSTLAVSKEAAKGGEPFLARNLDFFPMGVLDKYGLIALYQPEGYYGFVNVSWPCLNGVLSGMNEKGLCCAVMEVRTGRHSIDGMPSMYLFRRVMEEAATVEEACKILEEAKKVASNNLTLLDAGGASVVAEMGPGYCVFRKPEQGMVFATNHHRSGIKPEPSCPRYEALAAFCNKEKGRIDVETLQKVLHEVNQGMISVQSMVFEPGSIKLHLAMGKLPATQGEFKTFSFKEHFLSGDKAVNKTLPSQNLEN
ncbi:MAG: hypothetical protein KJ645_09950 [Planctomycetes bacterium]|nr:hypothetical protein [Planctomycetota bacterium]